MFDIEGGPRQRWRNMSSTVAYESCGRPGDLRVQQIVQEHRHTCEIHAAGVFDGCVHLTGPVTAVVMGYRATNHC
jgi:hypothetical protein